MSVTRTKFAKMIRIGALIFIVLIILGYITSRSLSYLRGPEVSIFQPVNGSAIASTTLTIVGRATRVNSLTMNGDTVQVDESGNFKETVIIFPGLNVISFYATDQFGRSVRQELKVLGSHSL